MQLDRFSLAEVFEMENKLIQWLHLKAEPIGIFLGNTDAACDFDASPDKRNCVIPFLIAASK
jgi:hypothetical protein